MELSANWKKLQAQIKAESTSARAAATPPKKRKAGVDSGLDEKSSPKKKRKKEQEPQKQQQKKEKKKKQQQHSKTQTQTQTQTQTHNQAAPKPAAAPSSSSSSTQMGNAHSSRIDPVPPSGVAPSLALWAAENDLSPEDVAEAYGLGLGRGGGGVSGGGKLSGSELLASPGPARPNEGLAPDVQLGKYVAIDCEMVGVTAPGSDVETDALARVSAVDFHGRQVYDSYVRPRGGRGAVVDWRTHISGVGPRHMAKARPFDEVREQIAELLRGRIVVGHDVRHDLRVLELDHPPKMIRDTARFSGFKKYGHGPKPALRVLAREILGIDIQTGQHSSIEDARVAMLLFRQHKPAFDVEHANRYPDDKKPKKGTAKKTKKKR